MHSAILLKIPRTQKEKEIGLLGLASPPAGWGMLFLDTPFIHMVGMRFPIDVVCLNGDFKVIAVLYAPIGAPNITTFGTRHILELASGTTIPLHIQPGKQMSIETSCCGEPLAHFS